MVKTFRGKKQKRGIYASANLGSFGKYTIGYNKRSLAKRALNKQIRNVVHNQIEPVRHKLINGSLVDLKQETWYTLNLLGNIPQGDTSESRSGDEIHLDAIKFQLYCNNGPATADTDIFVRVMIVKSQQAVLELQDTFGSGLGSPDLIQPSSPIVTLGNFNSRESTLVYDNHFMIPRRQLTGQNTFKHLKETIKVGNTFQYQRNANYGKWSNYYMVVAPYQRNAVTGTTSLVILDYTFDLIYKDGR